MLLEQQKILNIIDNESLKKPVQDFNMKSTYVKPANAKTPGLAKIKTVSCLNKPQTANRNRRREIDKFPKDGKSGIIGISQVSTSPQTAASITTSNNLRSKNICSAGANYDSNSSQKKNQSSMKKQRLRRRYCCGGKPGCTGDLISAKLDPERKVNDETLSKLLTSHPVNLAIKSINSFITHAFKIKEEYDVQSILNSGRPLGIAFPKSQIIDINFLRSREFLSFCKEKILRYLYSEINKSNGDVAPDDSKGRSAFHMNRFYIGRGNNSMLVRTVLKQRWWWAMNDHEDFFDVNFLWTQWRKNKYLSILDTKHPVTNQAMLELKKTVLEEHENEADSEDESCKDKPTDNAVMDAFEKENYFKNKIYNRLEDNFHLSNKSALFWNISEYYKSINKCAWDALPVTFNIQHGVEDPEYQKFLDFYNKISQEIVEKTQAKQESIRLKANQG